MEIANVQDFLPQRPPILMLDKVVSLDPGVAGIGKKRFLAEDPYFRGHFPGRPILPGVLAIEALAQTALIVLAVSATGAPPSVDSGQVGFLAKVDQTSFYKRIEPGQDIEFHIRLTKKIKQFHMIEGRVFRGEVLIAKSQLTLALEPEQPESSISSDQSV